MTPTEQTSLELPDLPGIGEGWPIVTVDEDARAGRLTGDRLERIRALRTSMLEALACGRGVKRVAEEFHVSPQVVRAIRQAAWVSGELTPLKERLGRDFLALADALRERVMENIDDVPLNMAVLASAQAADKGLLLTGAPTSRVHHDHTLTVASVTDYIEALPSATPVDAGERARQKDPAAAVELGLDEPAGARPEGGREGARDSESLVSGASPSEESQSRADYGQDGPKKEEAA